MADFSKQYCDNQDQGLLPGDFDIEEEFKSLKDGFCRPMICEGYGFSAVANKDDKPAVVYTDEDNKIKDIVLLSDLDEYDKKNILPKLKG